MTDPRIQKIKECRDLIAELELVDPWKAAEQVQSLLLRTGAQGIITQYLPKHVDEYRQMIETPKWVRYEVLPYFDCSSIGVELEDDDAIWKRKNVCVVKEWRRRILDYLEGLCAVIKSELAVSKVIAQEENESDTQVRFEDGKSPYLPGLTWSLDGRSLKLHGEEFPFTVSQSFIVCALIKASLMGPRDLSRASILEEAGMPNSNLRDLLKRGSAWNVLIVDGRTKGSVRLSLEPHH